MGWRMRPLAPAADRGWVKDLWAAALPPTWPPLPAAIAMLRDGLVAEAGADPVGLAAMDMAGSIPLILVHPAHQRRRGAGLAGTRDRHGAGHARLATPRPGRHPYLPHQLDHPRVLLPPGRLPAVATVRDVLSPARRRVVRLMWAHTDVG